MAAIARAVTGSDAPDAWTVELEPTPARRERHERDPPGEPGGTPAGADRRHNGAGRLGGPPRAARTTRGRRGGGARAAARARRRARRAVSDAGRGARADREPAAGAVLVAEADGELVGVLGASWQMAIHVPGAYALIQDLWVRPRLARAARSGAVCSSSWSRCARQAPRARRGRAAARELRPLRRDRGLLPRQRLHPNGPRMRRLLCVSAMLWSSSACGRRPSSPGS